MDENYKNDIERDANFIDDSQNVASHGDVIIKVIGVGGGGNNAVNHMYEQGIEKVSFLVCNTDWQALKNSPVPNRLLIGPKTTEGLGAGNNPELAREAAEESADDIAREFDDDTKMVFITAGMGGGTGTGAAPVVARIARDRGLLTIGIVTIPFLFEGEKKIMKALDGAEEMSKYVDALLVVNNEQLTEIYADLDWLNAFGKADDTLSNAARSISELITGHGYMNLDFKDVNTTLRNGGAAIISTGFGEGEHRVSRAIEDALNSPLLKNKDIFGSKRLLFNLYYSREADIPFKMGEAKELTSFISNIEGVDVIYGIAFDDTLGNKIKITILAAGFELSIKGDSTKKPKTPKPVNPFSKPATPPEEEQRNTELETMKKVYGEEKVDTINRARESKHYIILRPDQFDDDAVIEAFEHHPAFNRDLEMAEVVRNTTTKRATDPTSTSTPKTDAPGSEQNNSSQAATPPASSSNEIIF